MIKVKGEKGLVRDPFSKAIINTNKNALQEHRRRKQILRESMMDKDELNNVRNDVNNIKTEISDIKRILEQLLDRKE